MTVMSPTIDASILTHLTREFAARADAYDREGTFPLENIARLREAGLLGIVVPKDYGGAGRGLAAATSIVSSIAEGCASTALVLAMQYIHLGSTIRSPYWPASVRRQVLTEAVSVGALINTLRGEPALGSPARGGLPETAAERTGSGDWRLSGRKVYATGIPALRWLLVWARIDEGDGPRVGNMLVPANAAGIEVIETWDHLGMRATASHDVVFDGVELPADYAVDMRLPSQWSFEPAQAAWNALLLGAVYNGVARAARDWLVGWLKERTPASLGAPLATLPRFQEAVGEIDALLLVNGRLLADTALRADRDPAGLPPSEPGLVKYVVTTNAIAAVERALSLTGNAGLGRSSPLQRHYRDVLCSRVHTPQNDSILVSAGRAALQPAAS